MHANLFHHLISPPKPSQIDAMVLLCQYYINFTRAKLECWNAIAKTIALDTFWFVKLICPLPWGTKYAHTCFSHHSQYYCWKYKALLFHHGPTNVTSVTTILMGKPNAHYIEPIFYLCHLYIIVPTTWIKLL